MTRTPTNSLIVSRLDSSLINNPTVIADLLASKNFQVELVFLPKFARYIVICSTSLVASQIREFLHENLQGKAQVTFSIKDNFLPILEDHLWLLQTEDGDSTSYLELPLEDGSRKFLISPPLSPHSEWDDYNKAEDGPNTKLIYSPAELSHLLWDRFGGFDSGRVRRFELSDDENDEEKSNEDLSVLEKEYLDISEQPHVLFENIDNGVPAIVVDSVRNQRKSGIPLPKTAMPPV